MLVDVLPLGKSEDCTEKEKLNGTEYQSFFL